ncbi:MAG: response regulator, partial [Elusimicrobiota bacterium]
MAPLILVIDDEANIRKVLKGFLEEEGFRVVTAKDGAEARKAMAQAPDLALCDLKLPGTDGISLLKELRRARSVPVILMTAFGTIPAAVEAMRAGAYDFLAKPLDYAELKRLLRKALASAGAESREWVMEPAEG